MAGDTRIPEHADDGTQALRSREVAAVVLAGIVLAVATSWPLVTRMDDAFPVIVGDPSVTAWMTAWGGHALTSAPARLWDANIFWPNRDTYAFTDTLLGLAPFSVFGSGVRAAIIRQNVFWFGSFVLAFTAAYVLARELGLRRAGATIAAVAFAFAPLRLVHAGHLHVLMNGGVPLSLFLLVRGYRRRRAPVIVAGYAVAAWQITLGWNVGLPFAYTLGAVGAVAAVRALRRRVTLTRGVTLATAAGVLLFGLTAVFMARPYMRVVEREPSARRSEKQVAAYSPTLRSFVTAYDTSLLWGPGSKARRAALAHPIEQTIFPGVAVVALAVAGAFAGRHTRALRRGLAAGVVVFAALALGFRVEGAGRFLPFRALHEWAPGFDGVRTPGRLFMFGVLPLGILAGMMVDRATNRRAIVAATAGLVILLEGIGTPLPLGAVPQPPPGLAAAPPGVRLHLPHELSPDTLYMIWSTDGWPTLVNGNSGVAPRSAGEIQKLVRTFPDAETVSYLRRLGVRCVVVHPDLAEGTPSADVADRSIAGLGITRTSIGGVVIFDLSPPG